MWLQKISDGKNSLAKMDLSLVFMHILKLISVGESQNLTYKSWYIFFKGEKNVFSVSRWFWGTIMIKKGCKVWLSDKKNWF